MVILLVMFEAFLAFLFALGGFNSIDQIPAEQQEYLKAECNCSGVNDKSGVDYDTWKPWCLEYEAQQKDGGIITDELGAS